MLKGLNPMYCKIAIKLIKTDEIEKYKIYLFLNFANNETAKNVKEYSDIIINPSPRPTPTNRL